MKTQEIQAGFWIWTAPHPDWKPENDKPGGWGQSVASVYYDPSRTSGARRGPDESAGVGADPSHAHRLGAEEGNAGNPALVLIDPLAPPAGTADATEFWKALDSDVVSAGAPVSVLLGNEYHSRSAGAVLERYAKRPGASLWAHESVRGKLAIEPTRSFRGEEILPGGVRSYPLPSLTEGEVAYFLPEVRTIVFADAVIGTAPGQLRVCPPSWSSDADRNKREFRPSIRRLLDLDVERVIVSHGPSILTQGRRALSEALDAPAWGE